MRNYYIKILLSISILLLLPLGAEAKSQSADVLVKIENSLFNIDYGKQSDETRLGRIEKTVYGICLEGSSTVRLDRLSKDLSADLIGHEIKPTKDTFLEDDETIAKAEQDMNFTLVNNLEKKVFHYEFKTVDINLRLSALEGQVFKDNYSVDDLNTRIIRLQDAVLYKKFPVADTKIVKVPISQQQIILVENIKDIDPNIQLISLEKSILKTSYPSSKTTDRLAKLESKVFNSTFADDDEPTRLNRIEGAYQAKGSAKKYSGNRTSQRAATAIQMGTILLMIIPFLL